MKITATHHVGLFTPNFEAMKAFYTKTLGLPIVKTWSEPTIIFLAAGSTLIELIDNSNFALSDARPAGFDHFAFHVASVDESFAELVRAAGFERVSYRNMTGGIAALHSGWKI